jgi:hypothetical protein
MDSEKNYLSDLLGCYRPGNREDGAMKRLTAATCILLAGSGLPQAVSAQSALGANYNESLTTIDRGELQGVHARWLRGFVDMHLMNGENPEQDPNVLAILKARRDGFKTILSLKWNYHKVDFPRPGSPELGTELGRLDRLLRATMGKVDILVIGNEPFIEAKPGQADERLNLFYETLANAVIDYRRAHGDTASSTRLYMGALNRLDLPAKRTPAVDRMLRFIASKPELDGVDLHPHLPTLEANRSMLDYALKRIRPDQHFLATEFSLVWYWKSHIHDTASADFTQKYGFAPDTKVYQVIASAAKTPMPFEQWKYFLEHEPWYMAQQHFISDAMALYRGTGRLAVATYGIRQAWKAQRPFLATTDPWILNSVYASATVQHNPDGSAHENFPWADEFRKMQTVAP